MAQLGRTYGLVVIGCQPFPEWLARELVAAESRRTPAARHRRPPERAPLGDEMRLGMRLGRPADGLSTVPERASSLLRGGGQGRDRTADLPLFRPRKLLAWIRRASLAGCCRPGEAGVGGCCCCHRCCQPACGYGCSIHLLA